MIDESAKVPVEINLLDHAATYPEHDCYAWNVQHYHSSANYHMATCGVCKRVTGFRWRSRWMRIRSLFTAEPILTKVVDPDP